MVGMASFLHFVARPSAVRRTVDDVRAGLGNSLRRWDIVRAAAGGESAILELPGANHLLYLSVTDGAVVRVEWSPDTKPALGSSDWIIDALDRIGFDYEDN